MIQVLMVRINILPGDKLVVLSGLTNRPNTVWEIYNLLSTKNPKLSNIPFDDVPVQALIITIDEPESVEALDRISLHKFFPEQRWFEQQALFSTRSLGPEILSIRNLYFKFRNLLHDDYAQLKEFYSHTFFIILGKNTLRITDNTEPNIWMEITLNGSYLAQRSTGEVPFHGHVYRGGKRLAYTDCRGKFMMEVLPNDQIIIFHREKQPEDVEEILKNDLSVDFLKTLESQRPYIRIDVQDCASFASVGPNLYHIPIPSLDGGTKFTEITWMSKSSKEYHDSIMFNDSGIVMGDFPGLIDSAYGSTEQMSFYQKDYIDSEDSPWKPGCIVGIIKDHQTDELHLSMEFIVAPQSSFMVFRQTEDVNHSKENAQHTIKTGAEPAIL